MLICHRLIHQKLSLDEGFIVPHVFLQDSWGFLPIPRTEYWLMCQLIFAVLWGYIPEDWSESWGFPGRTTPRMEGMWWITWNWNMCFNIMWHNAVTCTSLLIIVSYMTHHKSVTTLTTITNTNTNTTTTTTTTMTTATTATVVVPTKCSHPWTMMNLHPWMMTPHQQTTMPHPWTTTTPPWMTASHTQTTIQCVA